MQSPQQNHTRRIVLLLASGTLVGACAGSPGNESSGLTEPNGDTASGGAVGSGGEVSVGTGAVGSGSASSGGPSASGGANGTATGGQASAGETGTATTTGVVIFHASFEAHSAGAYSESMVKEDFGATPSWNDGLDEGRALVVDAGGNKFLRVNYSAGEYGPGAGGVQFRIPFEQSYQELYLAYRVRFQEAYDWVKGGKLPGLIGGSAPTGCVQDDTGFSARMMWRAEGKAVQYIYYPNKVQTCGDDFDYLDGANKPLTFVPGSWHWVQHRIVMNDDGTKNGIMQSWMDGVLALDLQDFEWRVNGASYGVDGFYFSTFFGGGDASWAPSQSQIVDFDEILVSTSSISFK